MSALRSIKLASKKIYPWEFRTPRFIFEILTIVFSENSTISMISVLSFLLTSWIDYKLQLCKT